MEHWLANFTHYSDVLGWLSNHLPPDLMAAPSGNFNQDILGDFQKAFNNFVKTGQVWALVIGLALGYLFRSLTSF